MKTLNIATLAFLLLFFLFFIGEVFFFFHPEKFILYNKKENSWKEIEIDFPNSRMGNCTQLVIEIQENEKNIKQSEIQEKIEKGIIVIEKMNGEKRKIEGFHYYDDTLSFEVPSKCRKEKSNIFISFSGNIESEDIPGNIVLKETLIQK